MTFPFIVLKVDSFPPPPAMLRKRREHNVRYIIKETQVSVLFLRSTPQDRNQKSNCYRLHALHLCRIMRLQLNSETAHNSCGHGSSKSLCNCLKKKQLAKLVIMHI